MKSNFYSFIINGEWYNVKIATVCHFIDLDALSIQENISEHKILTYHNNWSLYWFDSDTLNSKEKYYEPNYEKNCVL